MGKKGEGVYSTTATFTHITERKKQMLASLTPFGKGMGGKVANEEKPRKSQPILGKFF